VLPAERDAGRDALTAADADVDHSKPGFWCRHMSCHPVARAVCCRRCAGEEIINAVGAEVDRIETEIQRINPGVRYVDLETDRGQVGPPGCSAERCGSSTIALRCQARALQVTPGC
jgi:hypothetical protein